MGNYSQLRDRVNDLLEIIRHQRAEDRRDSIAILLVGLGSILVGTLAIWSNLGGKMAGLIVFGLLGGFFIIFGLWLMWYILWPVLRDLFIPPDKSVLYRVAKNAPDSIERIVQRQVVFDLDTQDREYSKYEIYRRNRRRPFHVFMASTASESWKIRDALSAAFPAAKLERGEAEILKNKSTAGL